MASCLKPLLIGAFKADGVIAKGKAVKLGTDSEHVAKCTAASDKVIGLLADDVAAAEDACEVVLIGGAKGLLGGTVSAGDALASDANGKLVATTTGGDKVVGMAMESGVDGDLISVLLGKFNY